MINPRECKRGASSCTLNNSTIYRLYKYIRLINVRLINCSLSTYNTINIAATSIILSINDNCERKRNYNDENVVLFEILACTVV